MGEPFVPRFGKFGFNKSKPTASTDVQQHSSQTNANPKDGALHDRRLGSGRTSAYRDSDDGRATSQASKDKRPDPHGRRASNPDELNKSKYYVSDRRGDRKNLEYGYLHRYDIPSFHRSGDRRVIGLSNDVRLDFERENDKHVQLRHRSLHVYDKKPMGLSGSRQRGDEVAVRYIQPSSCAQTAADVDKDYISLSHSNDNSYHTADERHPVATDVFDPRARRSLGIPPDSPAEKCLSESDHPHDELKRSEIENARRNAELSSNVKRNPNDAEAWIQFAEHQSKMIRSDIEVKYFSSTERRTLADIRVTIIVEGLQNIEQKDSKYECLLLLWIEEGTLLWDDAKILREWQKALFKAPDSGILWMAYLDFIDENRIYSRYDSRKRAYIECLKTLQETLRRVNSLNDSKLQNIAVQTILRLTSMIRSAGYDELSIAIWQALLECYHFRPDEFLRKPDGAMLNHLAEFWELDVPRLGEVDAMGWKNSTLNGVDPKSRDSLSMPVTDLGGAARTWEQFATMELKCYRNFWLPASVLDESAADDPFRIVMFSDIKEIISLLDPGLSKDLILVAFLQYLGLPSLPRFGLPCDMADGLPIQHLPLREPSTCMKEGNAGFHAIEVRSYLETTYSLLQEAFVQFHALYGTESSAQESLCRFVDRVLEMLVLNDIYNDDLAEYYVGYKLQVFPAEVLKATKRLLKGRPDSLRLYDCYAMCEWKLGRPEKALQVWDTAMRMHETLGTNAQDDLIILWHSLIMAQIDSEQEHDALQSSLSIGNGQRGPIDPERQTAHHLKSTRILQEGFDRMLLAQKWTLAVLYADCLTWLAYLANNHDLQQAIDTCEKYSGHLQRQSNPMSLELMFQNEIHMIETHISRKRPYKPASILDKVEKCLQVYPNNSSIYGMYAKLLQQDRLRGLTRATPSGIGAPGSIVQESYKISQELRRADSALASSNQNTIRATFRNALDHGDAQVRRALSLWVAGLQFEHRCSDSKGSSRNRAKEFFFQGIRVLPLAKFWVVYGMCLLDLSVAEVRQVYQVVSERGLRLRVDVGDLADDL